MAAPLSYEPPANELNYYNGLFTAADLAQTGYINGQNSVSFLSRSKLPIDILKSTWNTIMAAYPDGTNELDRSKFYIAVRMIQLYQNGVPIPVAGSGGLTRGVDPTIVMRPPYFEGVTGVTIQPFQSAMSAPSPPRQGAAGGVGQGQGQGQSIMTVNSGEGTVMSNPNMTPAPGQGPGQGTGQQQQQQQQPPQQQPPNAAPGPSVGGGALTSDPYMMLPGEQVRYESLFPQYEKDGYVYGAEAVELFTKSGLDKNCLRDIWNLVDEPVDNRLSRLEFAIAMHLIVCVSKKNLPIPVVGALPPSLRMLKAKENAGSVGAGAMNGTTGGASMAAPAGAPGVSMQQPEQGHGQSGLSMSPPRPQQQMVQPMTPGGSPGPVQQQANGRGLSMSMNGMGSGGGMNMGRMGVGPPPVGGMGISDAFSGIQQQQQQSQQLQSSMNEGQHQGQQQYIQQQTMTNGAPAPDGIGNSLAPPSLDSEGAGAGSTALAVADSAANRQGLEKVQGVLQKLQAENISLKAQLGVYSEEEKQVRDEIARTVAEIGTLSQELTSLRGSVADAKSSLIEASSELKAQAEKRDMLKSLVGETVAMKEALESSIQVMQSAAPRNRNGTGGSSIAQGTHYSQPAPVDPFSYDATGSVQSGFTGGPVDSSSYYGGQGQANVAPDQGAYYPQQPVATAVPVYGQQQQQHQQQFQEQQYQSGPSEDELQMLQVLKSEAEVASRNAASADDQARAVAMKFEDAKVEAQRAQMEVSRKQSAKPKKKGLLGGGKKKKAAKQELETAMQVASEKNTSAQRYHDELKTASEAAVRMKSEADRLIAEAEAYEIQLAEKLTSPKMKVTPAPIAPVAPPMSQQQFGAMANEDHQSSPQHSRATDPYSVGQEASYGDYNAHPEPPTMGFGDFNYPGVPNATPGIPNLSARPGVQNEAAPMGTSAPSESLMGGVGASNLKFNDASSYASGSITYPPNYANAAPSRNASADTDNASYASGPINYAPNYTNAGPLRSSSADYDNSSYASGSINYAPNYANTAPSRNTSNDNFIGGRTDSSLVGGMSTTSGSINYAGDTGGGSLVSSRESNPNMVSDYVGYVSDAAGQRKDINPNIAPDAGGGQSLVSSKEGSSNPNLPLYNNVGYPSDAGAQSLMSSKEGSSHPNLPLYSNRAYSSDAGAQSLVTNKEGSSDPNLPLYNNRGYSSDAGAQSLATNKESATEANITPTLDQYMPTADPTRTAGSVSSAGISYLSDSRANSQTGYGTDLSVSASLATSVGYNSGAEIPLPVTEERAEPKLFSYAEVVTKNDEPEQGVDQSISMENSALPPTAPTRLVANTMSNDSNAVDNAFAGIPSPDKVEATNSDVFVQDGPLTSNFSSFAPASNGESVTTNIADLGIRQEDATVQGAAFALPTETWVDSAVPVPVPAQPHNSIDFEVKGLEDPIVAKVPVPVEAATNMMSNMNVNTEQNGFSGGIPSPDNRVQPAMPMPVPVPAPVPIRQPSNDSNFAAGVGVTMTSSNDASTSWTDGIPTPTASFDEFANPFAQGG